MKIPYIVASLIVIITSFILIMPTLSFASDAIVTISKPGYIERKLEVRKLNLVCEGKAMQSFAVEMDGVFTKIPFSSIKSIIYHQHASNFQLIVKDGFETMSLFALIPVCKEFKLKGKNQFGGKMTITPRYLERIDFK